MRFTIKCGNCDWTNEADDMTEAYKHVFSCKPPWIDIVCVCGKSHRTGPCARPLLPLDARRDARADKAWMEEHRAHSVVMH